MRPIPQVPGVRHEYVQAGDVKLHVACAGEGEPLLLVHGWPQNWWAWRKVIPDLARDHEVICPDLRGFGWSDAPPGDYDMETLAGDLLALLDARGLERVRMVGHDWGGFAGFLACLRAPERFERYVALGIVHPWFEPPPPTPLVILRISYQLLLATPVVGPQVPQRLPLVSALIKRSSHRDSQWTDEELAVYRDALRSPDHARATSSLYRTFLTKQRAKLGKEERRLRVPTLLMAGVADPVVRTDRLGGFEEHADDMRVEAIAGAGHWPAEEQPEEVVSRVRDFCGRPAPA